MGVGFVLRSWSATGLFANQIRSRDLGGSISVSGTRLGLDVHFGFLRTAVALD